MDEKYLTIGQINKYLEYKFNIDNNLKDILVKAEISTINYSKNTYFFTFKDTSDNKMSGLISSYSYSRLKVEPKLGDQVIVKGSVELYVKNGTYSLKVQDILPFGEGAYKLYLEKLKKELGAKGYFNVDRKRDIPKYPKCIAVVTSATGAVVKDISQTIRRRYSNLTMLIYPTLVQGTYAGKNIAAQIIKANEDNYADVIIIGRGGGSTEELACFNDEAVCDAIFNSRIPVISAVGHERDDTLSDLISDLRVSTPTAAAEIVTSHYVNVVNNIKSDIDKLDSIYKSKILECKRNVGHSLQLLNTKNPHRKIIEFKDSLNKLNDNLNKKINNKIYDYNNLINETLSKINHSIDNIIYINKNKIDNKMDNLRLLNPKEMVKNYKSSIKNLTNRLNNNIIYIIDNKNDLIINNINSINKNIKNIVNNNKNTLEYKMVKLNSYNPISDLKQYYSLVSNKIDNINSLINNKLETKHNSCQALISRLDSLSPTKLLEKGYSTTKHNNKYISSVKSVKLNDEITVELQDGKLNAVVKEIYDGK